MMSRPVPPRITMTTDQRDGVVSHRLCAAGTDLRGTDLINDDGSQSLKVLAKLAVGEVVVEPAEHAYRYTPSGEAELQATVGVDKASREDHLPQSNSSAPRSGCRGKPVRSSASRFRCSVLAARFAQ